MRKCTGEKFHFIVSINTNNQLNYGEGLVERTLALFLCRIKFTLEILMEIFGYCGVKYDEEEKFENFRFGTFLSSLIMEGSIIAIMLRTGPLSWTVSSKTHYKCLTDEKRAEKFSFCSLIVNISGCELN